MATVSRLTAEKNAKVLHELSMQPGNDRCADCKTRNPRWASHNLGIFICVHCASIHRKIGTHVSKVKSLNLDSWSKEQVDTMRNMGNTKSNAIYNADEVRNPPPTNMVDSERDSELEKFIRNKYEFKRFMNKSGAARAPPRAATAPLDPHPTLTSPVSAPVATSSFAQPPPAAPASANPYAAPQRSSTYSVASVHSNFSASSSNSVISAASVPPRQTASAAPATSETWNDLLQLRQPHAPTRNATLPLQVSSGQPQQPMFIPQQQQQPFSSGSYAQAGMGQNFGTGASPGFAAAGMGSPGSLSPGSYQGTGAANPFAQMMYQQQQQQQQQQQFQPQQQQQQAFLSSSVPTTSFARQPSPFQAQPFAQQPQQQPFAPQQPQSPPFQTTAQPFGQSAPNPFFGQQQQQQQFTMASPPPMNPGMGYMQPQQPQQQQQGAAQNPFTSWMNGAQPGFAGAGQWRPT